ncbi:VOC family protein [Aquabacterium sp. A3]|uniref:VOC family protein n=1 Tax=Aquabacterium sp. A3 TaxID=3132829 RepID=UPI003119FF8B
MAHASALRAPSEHPESALPAHVQKLVRPAALQKATKLAFLRFEKADLDAAQRFWTDFGLITVSRTPEQLVMRGAGAEPALLMARQSPRPRFVGAAFVVPADTDFERLQRDSGARPLSPEAVPGGARGVSLIDPDGHEVWLITDWPEVAPLPLRQPTHANINALGQTMRINATVRTPIEAAAVARLGHVVLQTTDFHAMADWYMRHLGLLPSDVQYLEDGTPFLTFFRLNLGATPADHHTVVIAGGLEACYEHSAWEVGDLDALGQGQQVLRVNGHQHLWGIGRHLLGSQLFDYWRDPDGLAFEHYTDGDLFTADREPHYSPFSTSALWAWGHDVPASMFPPKTPALLWRVLKLLRTGRITVKRLRMMARMVDTPARPWL